MGDTGGEENLTDRANDPNLGIRRQRLSACPDHTKNALWKCGTRGKDRGDPS